MEEEKNLKELVVELASYERRISSLWWNFLRGITYGLGFFIGSAIVTAVVIYLTTQLFHNTPLADSLNGLINTYNSVK